jgi:hypothetical protein
MSAKIQKAYAPGTPGLDVFPVPVLAQRAPNSSDLAYPLLMQWYNQVTGIIYIYKGAGSWSVLETSGGAGSFTSLIVTGQSTLAATNIVGATNINISGAATTTIGTGGTGAVLIGNGTGKTTITGELDTGAIVSASGNIVATTGNISTSAGNISAFGTVTGGQGLIASSSGVFANSGDIDANNGDVLVSTAGKAFKFGAAGPGLYEGTADPNGSVTAAKGSIFISTVGSMANDRAWINTDGGSTWTAIVTVA